MAGKMKKSSRNNEKKDEKKKKVLQKAKKQEIRDKAFNKFKAMFFEQLLIEQKEEAKAEIRRRKSFDELKRQAYTKKKKNDGDKGGLGKRIKTDGPSSPVKDPSGPEKKGKKKNDI